MRKLNLTTALLFSLAASKLLAQSPLDGHWEGEMVRDGAELTVSFDFANEATAPKATFDSPTLRAVGIPLRKVVYTAPNVHFELAGDVTTTLFDGEVVGQTINGSFREGSLRTGQFREGDARNGQFREGDAKGTFS